MSSCASTVRRPLSVSVKSVSSSTNITTMSKRYQVFRRKHLLPDGGFIESFIMGMAEFSCLGEQHFDLAGYPHESEFDAFAEDWSRLAEDASLAYQKMKEKK